MGHAHIGIVEAAVRVCQMATRSDRPYLVHTGGLSRLAGAGGRNMQVIDGDATPGLLRKCD